jgi:predicted nucleic acid-binding protein
MYLLSFSPQAQDALLEMVERGALQILPVEGADIPRVRVLMRKYRDLSMDLADATLVHVAEREGIQYVFTLDRRDFTTYRIGRRAFTIVP